MNQLILFLATCTFVISSCATNSASTPNESASSPASGELILTQPGAKTPIISSSDERHWNQLSKTGDSRDKLYGLLATGEWESAIEEARKELEKKPGDPGLFIALSAAYANGRNYEMAGYYAEQVYKKEPGNGDAMNFIGLRLMMSGGNRRHDYEEAITWFRKATDNDSTHVAAPLNMGYLQLDLGDSAAALESFSLASNRCSRCYSAQYGYGIAASRTQSWAQAKSAFEGVLSRENFRADAVYQLAMVHKNGFKDNKKAESLLQDIVSDADGRFKDANSVKRVANITLRRLRATDRSAAQPIEAVTPHGDEMPARNLAPSEETIDNAPDDSRVVP